MLGPATLAAGQIAGTTALEDLLLGSSLSSAPNAYRATLHANAGGGNFALNAIKAATSDEVFGAARVLLSNTASHQAAYGLRTASATGLRVLALNAVGSPEKLALNDLPDGCQFVVTPLAGALAHVIAWVPGQSGYQTRDIVEGPPDTFTAGPPAIVPTSFLIGDIVAVPAGNAAKLLLVSTDGGSAVLVATPGGAVEQTFVPPVGSVFTAVAAADGAFGGFQLLYGAGAGKRSTGAQAWDFDSGTGTYTLAAVQTLPEVEDLSGAGHVLVYAGEPFVAPNASLLKRLRAKDWSSNPALPGGNVQVTAESYGGPDSGLGTPSVMNLGAAPAGTTHLLISQFAPGISVYPLSAAEGNSSGAIVAQPGPGAYETAVQVTLTGPAGWTIGYRTSSSAAWSTYTGPIWLHRDTLLEAFGIGPGSGLTPILSAQYRFNAPAGELSSLDDGIPDYVKIGLGFDPLVLPDRAGINNTEETLNYLQILIEGNNVPSRNTSGAALDLHVRPHSHDGLAATDIPSLLPNLPLSNGEANPGNRVTVHDVSGEPLDTELANHFGFFGAGQTAARLLQLGRGGRASVTVASSLSSFALDFAPPYNAGTPFLGRELAGLIVLPASTPPAFVHPYGGGTDATEAAAWQAAAIAHYLAALPPEVGATIDPLDTGLVFVFERWVANRFMARGLLPAGYQPTPGTLNSNRLTLTSYRASEPAAAIPDTGIVSGLVLPAPEQLAALEQYASPLDTGHLLPAVIETLRNGLRTSPDPGIAALRAVTLELYRISVRWGGQFPGAFPNPLDALREFLGTGVMPQAYRNDWDGGLPPEFGGALTTLGPADYTAAMNGLATLLNLPTPRPVVSRDLLVRADSMGLTCTVLERFGLGTLVALVNENGRPFRFPGNFELVPGIAVRVTGFADVPPNPCALETLEVVLVEDEYQAFVTDVPVPPPTDADGNLLDDEWEMLFLGGLGNAAFASLGGGYTLLQSYFDGTDPFLPASFMAKPPANLQLPAVQIEPFGLNQVQLTWQFAPAYAHKLLFKLQSAPSLGDPWTDLPLVVQDLGGGQFQATAQIAQQDSSAFWRVLLGLK